MELDSPYLVYLIVFLAGLGLSALITPLASHIGKKWGMVAKPGGRRRHGRIVPQTGGIAVYIAFVGAVLIAQFFVRQPGSEALPTALTVMRFDPKEVIRVSGLLLGGTFIFILGLLDDRYDLPPLVLYTGQLIASAVAIAFLIIIEYVNNPFTGSQTGEFPYVMTVIVTLFWIGLMTNTVNWLDGLDGLATGVVALACVILFVNAAFRLDPPQHSVSLLPLALLGACLGFLPYNFTPARIFLGGGAFFLGYMLGTLSIIGGAKVASILLAMGLPLLDTAWQIINRIAQGRNPAQGDRGHLHFRLVDMGLSQRQIVLGYYTFCAVFGALSLLIPSRLFKFVALIVLAIISVSGFAWTALRSRPLADQAPPNP